MSKAVICDLCSAVCQPGAYVELSGWWGKHNQVSRGRRRAERWTLERKQERDGLAADVCRSCAENHLKFVTFSLEKTRETLLHERRQKHPEESMLAAYRHVSGTTVEGVGCDCCQTECIDRHLHLRSQWQNSDGEVLVADLCEACVNSELRSRIRLESVPPSSVTATASVS